MKTLEGPGRGEQRRALLAGLQLCPGYRAHTAQTPAAKGLRQPQAVYAGTDLGASLLLYAASVPSSTQWGLLILLTLQLVGLGKVLREECVCVWGGVSAYSVFTNNFSSPDWVGCIEMWGLCISTPSLEKPPLRVPIMLQIRSTPESIYKFSVRLGRN